MFDYEDIERIFGIPKTTARERFRKRDIKGRMGKYRCLVFTHDDVLEIVHDGKYAYAWACLFYLEAGYDKKKAIEYVERFIKSGCMTLESSMNFDTFT